MTRYAAILWTDVVVTDPTAFGEARYAQAMSSALGVDAKNVTIVVTGFEVSLTYELSTNVVAAKAKTAIAATAGVQSSAVEISPAFLRRLGVLRRLAAKFEAIIRTANATSAVLVMSRAVRTATLKAEFAKAGVTTDPSVKV